MVLKKEILSDLKKFNKDLEKYVGGVDFSSFSKDPKFFSENKNEEYFSLLVSNLSDVRTEFALFRKNFANDIENMVLRAISEQQNQFSNQMNLFNSNVVNDLKNNFSQYLEEVSENISNLKKEFVKIQTQNSSFDNRIKSFDSDLIELKSLLTKLDSKLEDSNIDELGIQISKNNELLSKNIFNIGQKIEILEKNNLKLKSQTSNINKHFDEKIDKKNNLLLSHINKLNEKLNIVDNNFIQVNTKQSLLDSNVNEKLNSINSKFVDINNLKENLSEIDKKITHLENKNSTIESNFVKKIEDMDSKLEYVSSSNQSLVINLDKKISRVKINDKTQIVNNINLDSKNSNTKSDSKIEPITSNRNSKYNINNIEKLLQIDNRIKNLESLR